MTAAGTVAALPAEAKAYAFGIVDGPIHTLGRVDLGNQLESGQILTVVAPRRGALAGTVAVQ
jgi:hypothetical protein